MRVVPFPFLLERLTCDYDPVLAVGGEGEGSELAFAAPAAVAIAPTALSTAEGEEVVEEAAGRDAAGEGVRASGVLKQLRPRQPRPHPPRQPRAAHRREGQYFPWEKTGDDLPEEM